MNPQRIVGLVMMVIGVVLLIVGLNASDSVADSISETFTGKYTDSTMWYILSGIALGILGLALMTVPIKKLKS